MISLSCPSFSFSPSILISLLLSLFVPLVSTSPPPPSVTLSIACPLRHRYNVASFRHPPITSLQSPSSISHQPAIRERERESEPLLYLLLRYRSRSSKPRYIRTAICGWQRGRHIHEDIAPRRKPRSSSCLFPFSTLFVPSFHPLSESSSLTIVHLRYVLKRQTPSRSVCGRYRRACRHAFSPRSSPLKRKEHARTDDARRD